MFIQTCRWMYTTKCMRLYGCIVTYRRIHAGIWNVSCIWRILFSVYMDRRWIYVSVASLICQIEDRQCGLVKGIFFQSRYHQDYKMSRYYQDYKMRIDIMKMKCCNGSSIHAQRFIYFIWHNFLSNISYFVYYTMLVLDICVYI